MQKITIKLNKIDSKLTFMVNLILPGVSFMCCVRQKLL
jgi:hypothetical protein